MRVISIKNYHDDIKVIIQLLQYHNKVCSLGSEYSSSTKCLYSPTLELESTQSYYEEEEDDENVAKEYEMMNEGNLEILKRRTICDQNKGFMTFPVPFYFSPFNSTVIHSFP